MSEKIYYYKYIINILISIRDAYAIIRLFMN